MSPTPIAAAPAPSRRLSRRLLGSGLLDALTAPHGVDRYVELVRPSWSLRDARAEVTRVTRQTADTVTLALRPNRNWQGFRAGQFISLTVEIDGVRETRCYSPACAEQPAGQIEITVKAHPEGKVSTYLNTSATPGMVVGLSEAAGDFVLPAQRPQDLVLVSGGSGITPVMAMLRTLCAEGHEGTTTFLHYAPTADRVAYRAELAEIAARHPNVRVVLAHTREQPDGPLTGHLCRRHLLAATSGRAPAPTYVCGPPGMLDAARTIFAEDGIEDLLHIESFLPPPLTLPTEDAGGSVGFAGSGTHVQSDGRTLLEQAEHAGLSPEFGCRMGICHSCTCRKTAGSVRNVLSGEVSSEPDEDIQICISVPVGDVQLDL
jgi:stearoyl-CoA 9-desaturase NADPH oxidoreductase